MATTSRLGLDKTDVRRARTLARQVGRPIVKLAQQHTTVSVERATLRLAGLAGADPDGTPWVNRLLDVVRADVGLEHGVALPVWHALRRGHADDLLPWPRRPAPVRVTFELPDGKDATAAGRDAKKAVGAGIKRIDANRRERERMIKKIGDAPRKPWIYLIVATGDIYEDIPQAQAAAREGADIIAVIRSTGQSPARLRARGRDPRGLRRHLRHPGELPPDAGGPRRDQRGSSGATSASPTTRPASACPRSPPWPASSGST